MTDRNDEITTLISNYAELQTKTEQITETIDKITQSKKSIINLSEEEDVNKKNIAKLESQIVSNEKDIENIKKSNEYKEFLQTSTKLDSMSSEKNKIKSEIEFQFTKISRPLNKYGYVSSLDKPQKKLLENLIANPYDVLIDANKGDIIKILESTRNGILSGSVSVKDMDKSILQIDETLSLLTKFIENILSFHQAKSNIENDLSNFNGEEMLHSESTLNKYQNDKSNLKSKIILAEKELSNMIEFIPKWIKLIESTLNQISAVQYTIKPE